MVEQAVATGQKKEIRIGLVQCHEAWLDEIDAQPPGLNHTFVAQPGQRPCSARHGDREQTFPGIAMMVSSEVVYIKNVKLSDPKALGAVLE